uniref:Uncharacterized protein n=1 Tax=Solanum tuberosum TaxID=4113 RepID=M1DY61_SOLTU
MGFIAEIVSKSLFSAICALGLGRGDYGQFALAFQRNSSVKVFESKCLGKEPIESRRIRVEKRARKIIKNLGNGGGAPRHSERPTTCSKVWALGRRATKSSLTQLLQFGLWRVAPLRAPGSPSLLPFPTPFCLSFLESYI